uniref:Uncharacterized protein n=1 Tax=Gadus morhua TaxID=8049 RepID=A0A8C5AP66_GADMO
MMKVKSNQTRTYDGDGFKKRAACLCFRSCSEEEVLLVSSSRHPDKWIVPGGGWSRRRSPASRPPEKCVKRRVSRALWVGWSACLRIARGSTGPTCTCWWSRSCWTPGKTRSTLRPVRLRPQGGRGNGSPWTRPCACCAATSPCRPPTSRPCATATAA